MDSFWNWKSNLLVLSFSLWITDCPDLVDENFVDATLLHEHSSSLHVMLHHMVNEMIKQLFHTLRLQNFRFNMLIHSLATFVELIQFDGLVKRCVRVNLETALLRIIYDFTESSTLSRTMRVMWKAIIGCLKLK